MSKQEALPILLPKDDRVMVSEVVHTTKVAATVRPGRGTSVEVKIYIPEMPNAQAMQLADKIKQTALAQRHPDLSSHMGVQNGI